MHGWMINCKYCGNGFAGEKWNEDRIGNALPKRHYQCPGCSAAFRIDYGPPVVFEVNGEARIFSGTKKLVEVAALY